MGLRRKAAMEAILSLPAPTEDEVEPLAKLFGQYDHDGMWIPGRALAFVPRAEIDGVMRRSDGTAGGAIMEFLGGKLLHYAALSRPVYSAEDGYLRNRDGSNWYPPDAAPRAIYIAIKNINWAVQPRTFGAALGWGEYLIEELVAQAAAVAMIYEPWSMDWRNETEARHLKPQEGSISLRARAFEEMMSHWFVDQMRRAEARIWSPDRRASGTEED